MFASKERMLLKPYSSSLISEILLTSPDVWYKRTNTSNIYDKKKWFKPSYLYSKETLEMQKNKNIYDVVM